MQDDEFSNLFKDSEPYIADNGFSEHLMASLPNRSQTAVKSKWLALLPFAAMLMAMLIVAFVLPIAQSFKAFMMQPSDWQNSWSLLLMVGTMIGVSLVWVNEDGLLKKL